MDENVPVLIVGGSLVGLTASALLGFHGVPHILVERHRSTAIHPRAASFHQRTLEIFRSVGLQDAVEKAAEMEFLQDGAINSVDTLGGQELASFYQSFNEGVEELSPTRRLFITQIGLEPVLRERAVELGGDLRFGTELTHFSQDEEGVLATLRSRDGGEERSIRARYMIAADGARSPVRKELGIPMSGRGEITQCATIYFKADVRPLINGRNLSVVYVNQAQLLAFFRFSITGDAGFLAVFASLDEQGQRIPLCDENISADNCAALVRAALGVSPEFPVEIEDVQPWTATAATAASFRQGNIFLAGDAAHVMPPTGGFGGNTGVADVHNLAWKLAMAINGKASPELLDSYDAERRPIADMTVEQAYRRYVERVDPSLPIDDLAPNIADTAIELGAIYRSPAIAGTVEGGELTEAPEQASARPGTRLPHHWLQVKDRNVSTLDLVGRGFTLIAGPDGGAWIEAASRVDDLDAYRIAERDIAKAISLADHGALIIRPDGVVGWRCDEADDETSALAEGLSLLQAM